MIFRFRMEKILHLLRLRETVKKMEVSALMKRISFMERRCGTLRSDIRLILDRLPVELESAPYAVSQIQVNSEEISRLEKFIEEEQAALDRKKRELGRLLMRRKAVESLREKRYKDFRVERNRKEQKRLDEASARKSREAA